jgi:hypothetical protein
VSAAIGAPVCIMHGGKAAQVRRKAEERVLVAEAKAAVPATVVVQKEPEEILIDVLADTNTMLQGIKDQMRSNVVNPHPLGVCGEWFDRVARIAKVVTDGDLSTKLHNRLGWMAQDLASQLTARNQRRLCGGMCLQRLPDPSGWLGTGANPASNVRAVLVGCLTASPVSSPRRADQGRRLRPGVPAVGPHQSSS